MKSLAAVLALFAFSAPAIADELVGEGDRFYLPVDINGVAAAALLDSGAEMTVLDPECAERAGIAGGTAVDARGTGAATARARLVEGVRIAALGRILEPEAVAVMDLHPTMERLGIRRIDAVLGRELFDAGRLAIDLDARTIEWAGEGEPIGARVPLNDRKGIATLPVNIGGVSVPADFDIGNGTGVLISQGLAHRLGLRPAGVEPGGGIGGETGREVVFVDLELAGRRFAHVRAHVSADDDESANVGAALLRHFRIVTDFPKHQAWLDPRD